MRNVKQWERVPRNKNPACAFGVLPILGQGRFPFLSGSATLARRADRPPEYQAPPRTTYTDLGWLCAALTGPATFLAVWIYCAVIYGFLLGFFLGWIPALILALLVAVATIFLWPLAAVPLLYLIYKVFGTHPHFLTYIAVLIAICAIAIVWWWHMVRNNTLP